MRHKTAFVFVLAASFLAASSVITQAQDQRVHVSLSGGYTAPNSDVRDRLGDGYNFNFGVDVAINPVVSIEALYSFNGLGDKRISIPVSPEVNPLEGDAVPTDFFGNMNMQYGTVFAELRYHYIWKPTIEGATLPTQVPDGVTSPTDSLAGRKANGQFLATTFGVRF